MKEDERPFRRAARMMALVETLSNALEISNEAMYSGLNLVFASCKVAERMAMFSPQPSTGINARYRMSRSTWLRILRLRIL